MENSSTSDASRMPEGWKHLEEYTEEARGLEFALTLMKEMAEALEQANEYPSSDGMILIKQKPIIDILKKFKEWK